MEVRSPPSWRPKPEIKVAAGCAPSRAPGEGPSWSLLAPGGAAGTVQPARGLLSPQPLLSLPVSSVASAPLCPCGLLSS